MDGPFGATRRKRKPAINITPLVDIMFLLLIFFMVSSTFRNDFGLDITLPQAVSAATQSDTSVPIFIAEGGRILVGEVAVAEEELRKVLQERLAAEPETLFKLSADRRVPFELAVKVIDTARAVGGTKLIIETEAIVSQGLMIGDEVSAGPRP